MITEDEVRAMLPPGWWAKFCYRRDQTTIGFMEDEIAGEVLENAVPGHPSFDVAFTESLSRIRATSIRWMRMGRAIEHVTIEEVDEAIAQMLQASDDPYYTLGPLRDALVEGGGE